jgi:hypothetical protein
LRKEFASVYDGERRVGLRSLNNKSPQRTPQPRRNDSLLQLLADLARLPWGDVDSRHYLHEYEASQWLPEARLYERQRAGLRRIVWHCILNVPIHRKRIAALLQPRDILSLDDPARLPIERLGEREQHSEAFVATTAFAGDQSAPRRSAIERRATRWGGGRWLTRQDLGIIAAGCERGNLHVQADHLLLEVVDGDDRPCAPGELGRLLVTDLHDLRAPQLRREIDERGALVKETCACGRALPLLTLDYA